LVNEDWVRVEQKGVAHGNPQPLISWQRRDGAQIQVKKGLQLGVYSNYDHDHVGYHRTNIQCYSWQSPVHQQTIEERCSSNTGKTRLTLGV
jgi:hypothetical protein